MTDYPSAETPNGKLIASLDAKEDGEKPLITIPRRPAPAKSSVPYTNGDDVSHTNEASKPIAISDVMNGKKRRASEAMGADDSEAKRGKTDAATTDTGPIIVDDDKNGAILIDD